jgi:Ca2+-binding RTX toxin-like protein
MLTAAGLTTAVLLLAGTAVGVPAQAAGPCDHPTVQGTMKGETLRGTEGPDVIAGSGGNDLLIGLGGDDVLCGQGSRDRLIGGDGDDHLFGGRDGRLSDDPGHYVYNGDVLEGGPGDDVLDGGVDPRHGVSADELTFEHATTPLVVDLGAATATGDGTDTIAGAFARVLGGPLDDRITGTDGPDWLYGGAGSDSVSGGGGDDVLVAGVRSGGPGTEANEVFGGAGGDLVLGDDGDDLLRGGAGDDQLEGRGGVDRSYGGAGSDRLLDDVAATDGHVLDGGRGHDRLASLWLVDDEGRQQTDVTGRLDMAAETLVARLGPLRWSVEIIGFESVEAPRGELWTLLGTEGSDGIMAGDYRDPVRIYARGGNDTVYGSDGDDLINGGPGRDAGNGWGGHDRIISVERIIEG